MGSKSSSKNNSTSTNAAQMAALQKANPPTTMKEAQANQESMQSSLMEQIMPAFGAMMQMGQDSMGNNPILKAFGPTSDGERSTLQDMIAILTPQQQQQPQQPQPQQMPPNGPFMHGQYIANQGMANGGQTAPSSASLYEQMMGNPYAGIKRDV